MATFIVILIAVYVAVVTVALVDLSKRSVRHLPKWAWAVIIAVSVPVGPIAYATVGRVPPHEEPVQADE